MIDKLPLSWNLYCYCGERNRKQKRNPDSDLKIKQNDGIAGGLLVDRVAIGALSEEGLLELSPD